MVDSMRIFTIIFALSFFQCGTKREENINLSHIDTLRVDSLVVSVRSTIDLKNIQIYDSISSNPENLNRFPYYMIGYNESAYAFGYITPSLYYVKTRDTNKHEYSIVKCGLDNKAIAERDISPWVRDFIDQTVNEGLCKHWHSCFQFDLRVFRHFVVLFINYYGEEHSKILKPHLYVFDHHLNLIDNAKDVDADYYLFNTKVIAESDSFFLPDVKGDQLFNYKDSIPSMVYTAEKLEDILWDRTKDSFYKSVINEDTLSVHKLFEDQKTVIKLVGWLKDSNILFINNDVLFLSHDNRVYFINTRSGHSGGYSISSAGYDVHPNKNGFFLDFNPIEVPGAAGTVKAYLFVPWPDSTKVQG